MERHNSEAEVNTSVWVLCGGVFKSGWVVVLYLSRSQGFKANTCMLQVIHSCDDHWIVVSLEMSGCLPPCTHPRMKEHIKLSRKCLAITLVPFE